MFSYLKSLNLTISKKMKLKLVFIVLTSIFLISTIIGFYFLNTDCGAITVEKVQYGEPSLKGVLYRPSSLLEEQYPVVILAHGVINTKEVLSGMALELARRGIIAFSIDLEGHGDSDGSMYSDDPTLGLNQAIEYVKTINYIDEQRIGLVGHSLGCVVIAESLKEYGTEISATVFIGMAETHLFPFEYTLFEHFNYTHPANFMIAVGAFDELFKKPKLKEDLANIFNTTTIEPDKIYGSIDNLNARLLISPPITHLFESMSKEITIETIQWMGKTFFNNDFMWNEIKSNVIYLQREIMNLLFLVLLIAICVQLLNLFDRNDKIKEYKPTTNKPWFSYVLWAFSHMVLFALIAPVGLFITILPAFLADVAVIWLAAMTFVGGVYLFLTNREEFKERFLNQIFIQLNEYNLFKWLVLILIPFSTMVIILLLADNLIFFNVKLVIPIFNSLFLFKRLLLAIVFGIVMFGYFIVDNIFLQGLFNTLESKQFKEKLALTFVKTIPFVCLLALQYIPLLAFGIQPIEGYLAFTLFFFAVLIPYFILFNVYSINVYYRSRLIIPSALLCTLIFAWSLSTIVPLI